MKSKALTEVELELMNLLWKRGEASVNDVLADLPKTRKLAYTSVSTILRILEQKGVLAARKEGRGHVYVPKLSKQVFEAKMIKYMTTQVFDGAPVALVKQLLEVEEISSDDLKAIRKMLDERIK